MADQAPTEEKKMENDTTEPATKDDEQNDRIPPSEEAGTGDKEANEETEDEPVPAEPAPARLNFQQKYNVRAKPTMKNVLVEYGLPEEPKKKKVRINVPPARRLRREKTEPDAAELERRRVKEEHYLQIYDDVYRLRDLYYATYNDALKKKITRQKEEIRLKDEELENKIKEREERVRAETMNKVRSRMARREIKHDDAYLRKIPKTNYYKIVKLVDQLQRNGDLRTQHDLNNFWQDIQKPDVFRHYFPTGALPPAGPEGDGSSGITVGTGLTGLTRGTSPSLHQAPSVNRHMSLISESRESRPPTSGSAGTGWAITHQASHVHRQQLASPTKTGEPAAIAKQAAMDLEKRLGSKPLPKLHCFTMNLAGDRPDPEEVQFQVVKQVEAKQREKDRRQHVRKLRHMYQLALSNKATSQRILDKHGQLDNPLDSTTVDDLTSNLDMLLAYEEEEDEEDDRPWTKHLKQHAIVPIEEAPEEQLQLTAPTDTTVAIKTKSKSTKSKKSAEKMKALPAPPLAPPPLSLNHMAAPRIVEAKCLSSLWTNYTKDEHAATTVE